MATKTKTTKQPVIVTTEHRGVFFGYINPDTIHHDVVALAGARLCVYWSRDMQGFMGLASKGPSKDCKIGPATDIPSLRSITGIFAVTKKAEEKWTSATWS